MATTVVLPPAVTAPGTYGSYVETRRPWLTMYGLRVRRTGYKEQASDSLLQRMLPEEMLIHILSFLPPADLGTAQLICRQWRRAALFPGLWKAACEDAFRIPNIYEPLTNDRLVQRVYKGCWRRMFLERPHVRFDGIYVARNTHLRTGIVEWHIKNPVHLVAWFRYYRFFPDGVFAYRTTPNTVAAVAKTLLRKPRRCAATSTGPAGDNNVFNGQYRMQGDVIWTAILYGNTADTEIRHKLKLRSTTPGANNRMDITKMVSFDRTQGVATQITEGGMNEDDGTGPAQRTYNRGNATFVFVPFHQVADSVFNLPVSQMDFYVPG